ncbi:MAG TPA: TIGR02266 family protein, partial [Thermoanaerobaculia bacterium]|nr:TIGR02266 family protein [Thermoanaerobaculia bacterium]
MHVPPRIYRRVPFKTAVRFEFDRFRGFIEEYSANLSLGGMFIRTDTPPPMGTVLPIEFRLGNDYELIKGTGRVVWVREEGLDEENPAGIGIRFLELTPGSRELIFRMVERRVREGGVPFDVEQPADLLPGRPPEPGPAPEGEIAAVDDDEDDDMPLLAPLPPAAPPSEPAPSAAAAAEPVADKAPEQAPERPATPPPAAPTADMPATAPADTREAPRPIVDLPRSTSLPPNLSPFTVEEEQDEEPTRHEAPKPSFFTLPEDETDEPAAAPPEPEAEPTEPEPQVAAPLAAAPPSAAPETSAPPIQPLAASPAEQEPVFSFGEDDESFFPRESAAEPAPPPEPQQEDEPESRAEPEETYEPSGGDSWDPPREEPAA